MRSSLRRTALAVGAGSMILWCSCERHHPEELQPAQDGHQNETAHAANAQAPNASPTAAHTPANFFPRATATPH